MSRLIANAASALAPTYEYTTDGITCGDVAIAPSVLRRDDGRGLVRCAEDEESSETVELDLVAPVAPGDRLLVHAGIAFARLTEEAPS